jgi:hypothetical protein
MIYSLHKFNTRGIGVISNKFILKDEFVGICCTKNNHFLTMGRYIHDGWFEAPPLGRYINHNANSNLYFLKKDSVIELYAKNNIEKYCELTINYIEISQLLNLPNNLIASYNIMNFDYINENIIITKKLL